jgi:hypothetical protein
MTEKEITTRSISRVVTPTRSSGARRASSPTLSRSAGCIFAELLSREVLFLGKDEVDQLRKIFSLLGEPDEASWAGYAALARGRGFRFLGGSGDAAGVAGGGVDRLRTKVCVCACVDAVVVAGSS